MTQKTIVVTGVTRGLGRAMTQEFIRAGHTVAGIGRDKAAIAALTSQFPEHLFSAIDITDATAVDSWAQEVISAFGVPDILVNNAGIINANAPLWEVPTAEFSQLMDVNINGVFHMIKAFVPAMVQQQRGVIVNFSSGWGRSVAPDVAAYCGSKWGIEGLTQGLAEDLPKGMAAVALNPGVIHTKMLESCFGDQAAHCIKPDDWAKTAVPTILGITAKDNGVPLTV
jgi:NAD(P)-dependent dehydrogenase (short-subunit alcohol dehydrogenase family)